VAYTHAGNAKIYDSLEPSTVKLKLASKVAAQNVEAARLSWLDRTEQGWDTVDLANAPDAGVCSGDRF
jgi:hypothetical protein